MEFKRTKTYTKINESGYVELFHKFYFVACINESTERVAQCLLSIIKKEYLPFVKSTINDIWIVDIKIIEKYSHLYKLEVIFRDRNEES